MILESLKVGAADFERRTGWEIRPEGACRGDVCVPLPEPEAGYFDVRVLAERLGMPLVADSAHGLWALGPESGPALASAKAPEFTLPDWRGGDFSLGSQRGRKVLLVAWAPW